LHDEAVCSSGGDCRKLYLLQQSHSRIHIAGRPDEKNPPRTMEKFQQSIQPLSACKSQPIVSGHMRKKELEMPN